MVPSDVLLAGAGGIVLTVQTQYSLNARVHAYYLEEESSTADCKLSWTYACSVDDFRNKNYPKVDGTASSSSNRSQLYIEKKGLKRKMLYRWYL